MGDNVYLITAMQDCPECEGERTVPNGTRQLCAICDGKGSIFVRTSLITALRDLRRNDNYHEQPPPAL